LLRSDYRKPRRRPAHLRTKTGCLTCKQALRTVLLDYLFTKAAILTAMNRSEAEEEVRRDSFAMPELREPRSGLRLAIRYAERFLDHPSRFSG
jgi:hypothetical protein